MCEVYLRAYCANKNYQFVTMYIRMQLYLKIYLGSYLLPYTTICLLFDKKFH